MSVESGEMEVALGGPASRQRFVPDYGHLTVFGHCEDCNGTDR